MAISPPSDIVLDVARAVEPSGVEAARAELVKRAGGLATEGISGAFSLIEARNVRAAADASRPESFKRFEAMVLQTFIQNMLPKEGAAVYGKGVAGDMWKSLLAEQLADVMAERGGIGISDRVLGDHYRQGERKLSVGAVSRGLERAEADRQGMLATELVQELQRKLARTLVDDPASASVETKV